MEPSSPAQQTTSLLSSDQQENDASRQISNNGQQGTENAPNPLPEPQASLITGPSRLGPDSESYDSDTERRRIALERYTLPPHLFGALGHHVQQLLLRNVGANATKTRQILQKLQATGDEGQQLQALLDLCQMLVMGSEDILADLPVKQIIPAVINLLNKENNFEMTNHACRALIYMMEVLPHSSALIVEAVPAFLKHLQVIQYMDVAEQALNALDILSRSHSKAILKAGGVSVCLMYFEFLTINAQQSTLSIVSNCCMNLHSEEFHLVADILPQLANLLTLQDKKIVETVCSVFSRLVDSLQNEPNRLMEIASTELFIKVQQLLVVSSPVIGSGTFITILRMLSVICIQCPKLGVTILKQNLAETLLYLLTGNAEANVEEEISLVPRSNEELYEIIFLSGELMPGLPADGIFSVDALLEPQNLRSTVTWEWCDDRGLWHAYSPTDSTILETARLNGAPEILLCILGRIYNVNFRLMQQINEDTGSSRPVQRRFESRNSTTFDSDNAQTVDSVVRSQNNNVRVACLRKEKDLAASVIRSLLSVLHEVYSFSADSAVRYKSVRVLLRMVYYADADLLQQVLKSQRVCSHIADMMASNDLRIVVGALQLAEVLMSKLPEVFGVHFRREGVMYQINQLANSFVPRKSDTGCCNATTLFSDGQSLPNLSLPSGGVSQRSGSTGINNTSNGIMVINSENEKSFSSATTDTRRPDADNSNIKRKKHFRKSSDSSPSLFQHENFVSFLKQELNRKTPLSNSTSTRIANRSQMSGVISQPSSFSQSLNPDRCNRNLPSSRNNYNYNKESIAECDFVAHNKEKIRNWVREQASKFIGKYSDCEVPGHAHTAVTVLSRLTAAVQKLDTQEHIDALCELRNILIESDISVFEATHSGVIKALLSYLALLEGVTDRDQRIRNFLHIFVGCPLLWNSESLTDDWNPAYMSALVAKLQAYVSLLEQFPVKVHEFPIDSTAIGSETSASQFYDTHHLKFKLERHPECTNLRKCKETILKIQPFASVQDIERYLLMRGYDRLRDKNARGSDEDSSSEDTDDTFATTVKMHGNNKHRMQLLIGNNALPSSMTVYQAFTQYSHVENIPSQIHTDNETPPSNLGIWMQTHTIYYRLLQEEAPVAHKSNSNNSSSSNKKNKGLNTKSINRRHRDDLWNEGIVLPLQSPLSSFLISSLPNSVTIQDASLEVICLLRILYALNRYWNTLYVAVPHRPLLPNSGFLNRRIGDKAGRQLRDSLALMTGVLPSWIHQLAAACPFLFPFEVRHLLFYITSFDRNRALQRLLNISSDSLVRKTPRLDRYKITISRDNILKQAEQVIKAGTSSNAMLEVQYKDEVGTGLGPTAEFYVLVSHELQRRDLQLWHNGDDENSLHANSPTGLFPAPLARSTKASQLNKIKGKFRFIGRFMAKAVMDSRMLDMSFSPVFYRWLLGQEHCLNVEDIAQVVPAVHSALTTFRKIIRQRETILSDPTLTSSEKKAKVEGLQLDGCLVSDLGLNFVLPGYSLVELRKGGAKVNVDIHNLDQYVRLVTHWYLIEGVSRQMEALREGFESIFPLNNLRIFYPEELEAVFCGNLKESTEGWDIETLMACCKSDHGYTPDSRAIRFLFEVLSSYDAEEQRLFVQFITGSPRLPIGGFKSLTPPLTIVRKAVDPDMNADDFLPSVMTCMNYLKLPDYSTVEVMRAKLKIATTEGQYSFHLS